MAFLPLVDLVPAVAMICRQAPEPVLIEAFIRAARTFCAQTRWLKTTLSGAPTVIGQQVYTLAGDPYQEVVGIRAASAQRAAGDRNAWPLTAQDSTAWNTNEQPGAPRFYSYVPEAQIALHPASDAVYLLNLTLVLQPKRGANQIDESLAVKWDQVLQAGALAYLLGIPDMPWTNPQQAEMQRRVFQSGINNARADEQRGHNAGTVIRRSRVFITNTFR